MRSRSWLKKGYEPPIHNFNIIAPDGNDITGHILSDPGYTFLLISYDVDKGRTKAFEQANDLYHVARAVPGLEFYAVTASNEDALRKLRDKTGIDYDFCLADEITLKTIVRSDPGLLLLHDGTVLAKWGSRDFPGEDELAAWKSVFIDYPLCEGCNPSVIASAPYGAVPGKVETVLKYRNLRTDSVASFTIDNFPRNTDEWTFESSGTKPLPGGFRSPFADLKITSVYGMDYTDIILENPDISFLVFLRSPFQTDAATLKKLNMLAGLAGDHLKTPFEFYGLTDLSDDEILRFTDEFVSPMEFYHVPRQAMDIAGDHDVLVIMLRNGKIEKVWKDGDIPAPKNLEGMKAVNLQPPGETLLPLVLKTYRNSMEKRLVYDLLFAFFTIVFLIRTILDSRNITVDHAREDR